MLMQENYIKYTKIFEKFFQKNFFKYIVGKKSSFNYILCIADKNDNFVFFFPKIGVELFSVFCYYITKILQNKRIYRDNIKLRRGAFKFVYT